MKNLIRSLLGLGALLLAAGWTLAAANLLVTMKSAGLTSGSTIPKEAQNAA